MAITIEPLGGLGNQLFVYATGRARALDLGTELHADLRHFVGYEWHNYELNGFANDLIIVDPDPRAEARRRRVDLTRRLQRRLHKASNWGAAGQAIEESTRFDPRVNAVADGTRLRGYFQSAKYFSRHSEQIRAEVCSIINPSEWFRDTVAMLATLPAWSAVHVRRGNYVGLPNMGIAGEAYYIRALRVLAANVGRCPLVVFSDDAKVAREMSALKAFGEVLYIEPPVESRPLESLLAMSHAHHMITANSSYSWWAAWLADRADRLVICPRPWLDDPTYDERDLLLPEWITVGRG